MLNKTLLSGNDFFYTICKIFPLLFRQTEVDTQIQDCALTWSPFCSKRVYEFISIILFPGLFIFVENLSNKHERRFIIKNAPESRGIKIFWHYTRRDTCNLLILLYANIEYGRFSAQNIIKATNLG